MTGFILLTTLALALLGLVLVIRLREQQDHDRCRELVRLHFPPDLGAESTVAFVRSLAALPVGRPMSTRTAVVFEVLAREGRLEHRLRLHQAVAGDVRRHLEVVVPGLQWEVITDDVPLVLSEARELAIRDRQRTIRTDQPSSAAAAVLTALAGAWNAETVVLQVVAAPDRGRKVMPPAPRQAPRSHGSFEVRQIVNLISDRNEATVTAKELRDKTAEPLFGVSLRIGAGAPKPQRARVLVDQMQAVLRVVERPGVHFRRLPWPRSVSIQRIGTATTPSFEFPATLNARELATIIAWPVGSPAVPGLARSLSRRLPAPAGLPDHGRSFGVSSAPGSNRTLAISAADSLHHAHLIGPTGVGKSTLLAHLAIQDLEASRGLVVIDPKGDLVATILDRVPAKRAADVIVLDPTSDQRPVGLNLLADGQSSPDRVADEVVGLFHRLFAASWGPRTADVLHACILTLTQTPGMTLCELPSLLVDEAFRGRLVAGVTDRVLLGFWAWYDQLSPGERAQAIGPVMNKLRAFLLRRRVRLILGQAEPTWTIEEVLNQRKVLLVNLARGDLGSETAALVGSLVVAQLWRAIQRRTLRLPVMAMIDEFQDVINLDADLGEVLAQARSFGVGLTLAHQHLGQLDTKLKAAVLANGRTKVIFQTSADDAAVLAKQLGGGLTPADLMRLPAHEAYVAACVGGQVLSPASLRTEPLPDGNGQGAAIRAASRQRYGRGAAEVEAAMADRQATPAAGSLGRRVRGRTSGGGS